MNKKVIVFGLDGLNQHRRRFAGTRRTPVFPGNSGLRSLQPHGNNLSCADTGCMVILHDRVQSGQSRLYVRGPDRQTVVEGTTAARSVNAMPFRRSRRVISRRMPVHGHLHHPMNAPIHRFGPVNLFCRSCVSPFFPPWARSLWAGHGLRVSFIPVPLRGWNSKWLLSSPN